MASPLAEVTCTVTWEINRHLGGSSERSLPPSGQQGLLLDSWSPAARISTGRITRLERQIPSYVRIF